MLQYLVSVVLILITFGIAFLYLKKYWQGKIVNFRTIYFTEEKVNFEYPINLPIPKIGETVYCKEYGGRVADIIYRIEDEVMTVEIIVNY